MRVYPPTIRRARTCQARRAATSRACQPGVCGSTSTSSPSSHTAISARSLTGAKTADLARRHGVSEATIYNWKSKYGGLEVSDARRLKELESENAKLKRLLADAMLDQAALRDLLAKKF